MLSLKDIELINCLVEHGHIEITTAGRKLIADELLDIEKKLLVIQNRTEERQMVTSYLMEQYVD